MTSRMFRGRRDGGGRGRDEFERAQEGHDRHGLAPEVSCEIWDRVCRGATDGYGRRNDGQAERRFHQVISARDQETR